MDWETAARLRTVVKGRTMPALKFKDRANRKSERKMSTSYFVEQLVKERLSDVKADAESLKWMADAQKAAIKQRKEQDELVRKGANRKPKSEWKKPGRVAGKIYPKYEAAMKRVAAERHRAAEQRNAKTKK